MRIFRTRKNKQNRQAGLTIVEVMIAATVMAIGFSATLGLVLTAIASNNRNRMDSTATMIGQAVVENISSVLVGSGTDNLTDCAGNTWTINTSVGGAALSSSQIDFTEATPPTNYKMNYVVCNVSSQTTYDVRWNIQTVTANTYLITVGVRMKGQGDNGGGKYFALPINLRTYVSN